MAVDRFDKDGHRLSRQITDAKQTAGTPMVEELADGAQLVETAGEDKQGRKVRVIQRYEKDGSPGQHRLVREDGMERTGDERWVVTRWVPVAGEEVRMRETYGPGKSISDQAVLEKRPAVGILKNEGGVVRQEGQTARRIPDQVAVVPGVAENAGRGFVTALRTGERPVRVKVPIDQQLAELAKLERAAHYFAGATAAQYESARLAAERFVFELPQPPQKALPANVPAPRFALRGTAPPLPAFVRLATDLTEEHPLGLHGRTAIRLHP